MCGCGGARAARRQVPNMVKSPSGVLKAVAAAKGHVTNDVQSMSEERRKIEKLRRDAVLRALGRP